MHFSLEDIRRRIFITFQSANIFVFTVILMYTPILFYQRVLVQKMNAPYNIRPYVFVLLSSLILLILSLFAERLSQDYRKLTVVMAYTYLMGLGLSYYYTYPTAPMLITLLTGIIVPAILLENTIVYWSYHVIVLFFYGITLWMQPATILTTTGVVSIGMLDTQAKTTVLITIIVTIILITFIRKAVLKHMLGNLYIALEDAKMSELKYKGLIEGLEDAVYSLDRHGLTIAHNNRFSNQIGLPVEACIGLDYTQWTLPSLVDPKGYHDFWIKALAEVKTTKSSFASELTYQLADSDSVTVMEVRLIPILNEMGEVELIIGSNRDVTELVLTRKQIHDFLEHENEHLEMLVEMKSNELKEATQELYRSERLASLGRLVAGVAHEINTPLGVALTGSSYLVRTSESAFNDLNAEQFTIDKLPEYMESVKEAADIISRNLNRAAKLVSNFRDIAETESHDLASRFSLSEHLNAMILSLYHEYKNKRVVIQNLLKENMIIYGQPSHYTQIMTNLLMNSLIHGYREEDELLITIDGEMNDKQLQLIYKDSGKGIPQENLSKIFEPFFTTARHSGGTGLGLSLIYNIVSDRLGGSIQCDSTLGEGTQFIMKLPLLQDPNDEI